MHKKNTMGNAFARPVYSIIDDNALHTDDKN